MEPGVEDLLTVGFVFHEFQNEGSSGMEDLPNVGFGVLWPLVCG